MRKSYYIVHCENGNNKTDTIFYTRSKTVAEHLGEKIHFMNHHDNPKMVSSIKIDREAFWNKAISLTCKRGIVKSIDSVSNNGDVEFTLGVDGEKDYTIQVKPENDIQNWYEVNEDVLNYQSIYPGVIIEFDSISRLIYRMANPIIVPKIYGIDYTL